VEHDGAGEIMNKDNIQSCFVNNYSHRQLFIGKYCLSGFFSFCAVRIFTLFMVTQWRGGEALD